MDFERKFLFVMVCIHAVLNLVALALVVSQVRDGLYGSAVVYGIAFAVTLLAIVRGIQFLREDL